MVESNQNINPYSDTRFIGYVTMVSPLLTRVHFPSSVLLKNFYHSNEGFHALVGKYVVLEGAGNGFLGKITEISIPEKERLELTESKFSKEAFHPTGKVEILLCFDNYELKAKKGLDQLPPVSAKVYLCSNRFLSSLLRDFGKKEDSSNITLPLAALPGDSSCIVNVASQALFGRHCAVVGTTGGGKSWTVAKLIEEVIAQNGKAILIDATGEYKPLSENNSRVKFLSFNNQENGLYFDYKNMKESDLIAMFRPAGQTQLPKFQDAIKTLRLRHLIGNDNTDTKTNPKITELLSCKDVGGSPVCFLKQHQKRKLFSEAFELYEDVNSENCHFDLNHLPRQINLECVYEFPMSYDQNKKSEITQRNPTPADYGSINERDLGNCHSLISRIKTVLLNKNFSTSLGFKNMSETAELTDIINKFLLPASKENVIIISVENVSTENNLREILVNAIGKFFIREGA